MFLKLISKTVLAVIFVAAATAIMRYPIGFGPVNWPHNFVSEVIQNVEVMGAWESKASHPVADTKQRVAPAGFPFLSSPIPAGSPVLWTMSLTLQVGLLLLITMPPWKCTTDRPRIRLSSSPRLPLISSSCPSRS